MTREERTIITLAMNDAKRAWLEQQGGYKAVELDALNMDRRIQTDDGLAARARHMREVDGLSYARIGKLLRCSHGRVYGWCNPGYFSDKSKARYRASKKAA